ncbi:hypothetical protein L4G92_00475 [Neisseria sp. ZJ106]|uniref:ADP-ribosyl-(Dinitrogen reductase) hydrolase n=1 Tax=Neisseria lisongii TaxID=2912188 RepID=A0ABY7RJQ8_9NEIS|nr:hypothetical protein [Neisseria lisongii]MCF7520533.1 hypothetical protein [Neisseria lisongii]WCL71528.1 hypothetical protein PJU73_09455 [Neisseria lisongii]
MLKISDSVYFKLKTKHGLCEPENDIIEAFSNMTGGTLIDIREEHQSDPPTEWFVAETNKGLKLKVCFINKNGEIHIRTAYPANEDEIRIYEKYK